MNTFRTYTVLLSLSLLLFPFRLAAQEPVGYVDPFIGTANGGNTFPGAVRPWGMVSVSPHNSPGAPSGYIFGKKNFTGFGHVHLSGTGCADLGSIILSIQSGDVHPDAASRTCTLGNEKAEAGYYSAELTEPGVVAEVTATARCGMTKFTPHVSGTLTVLINAGESLALTGGGMVNVVSATEMEGANISGGFCGETNRQTVYFVARFSRPAMTTGTWIEDRASNEARASSSSAPVGGWATFPAKGNEPLLVKVGISYVSTENARKNLDREMREFHFDEVRNDARREWNAELSRIRAEGGKQEDYVKFYTALYHMLLHPNVINDVNGDYPLMGRKGVGHVQGRDRYSVFSLWDTYRTLHPFLTLAYPERQAAIINTMVDMAKESGWLPKWELAGNETYMMVGDGAAAVIADSYVKGIRDFDARTAFEAMTKPALATTDSAAPPIRPGYHEYLKYHYIPFEQDTTQQWWTWGPVSTTQEYCLDDWATARMADSLGEQAGEFDRRSGYYKNVFDTSTDLVRPKRKNGAWLTPFDPLATEGSGSWSGSGGPGFVEGNAWQYTWFVPHDVDGLIRLFGGGQQFAARLKECFDRGYFTINNEPDIAYPYLFTYVAGEEQRTALLIQDIMAHQFGTGPGGLPGNDDCGTLSAWFVFSALGFYPACPAADEYRLGIPLFRKATITLNRKYYGGQSIVVEKQGKGNRIHTVSLNGREVSGYRIRHSMAVNGGVLRFSCE